MERIDEAVIRKIVKEAVRRLEEEKEGIVVGVSNRHMHLSAGDLETLFGKGYQLTKVKDLRQTGEFAAAETCDIIGPKGTIKKVRVLGPLRPKTQVEISMTDAFALGIDAPVRESGKTEGTPGIVIEGPAGRITREEGLIVALRHVHMDPAYANAHGIKNGEFVSVRTKGGRNVVFRDVLARVSDNFKLEMHVDTDEANASGLKSGDFVWLEK